MGGLALLSLYSTLFGVFGFMNAGWALGAALGAAAGGAIASKAGDALPFTLCAAMGVAALVLPLSPARAATRGVAR